VYAYAILHEIRTCKVCDAESLAIPNVETEHAPSELRPDYHIIEALLAVHSSDTVALSRSRAIVTQAVSHASAY